MNNNFIKNYVSQTSLQGERLSVTNWCDRVERTNSIDLDAIIRIAADIGKTPLVLFGFLKQNKFHYRGLFKLSADICQKAEEICQQVKSTNSYLEFDIRGNSAASEAFCAGFPLKTPDGALIGVLCLINFTWQGLSGNEKKSLENLAQSTTWLIEQKALNLRLSNLC